MIRILILALLISSCGVRKVSSDKQKEQTEEKAVEKKEERKEYRKEEEERKDIAEKEKVKEITEKFDDKGNITERKTTEVERDKTDKSIIKKNTFKLKVLEINKAREVTKLVTVKTKYTERDSSIAIIYSLISICVVWYVFKKLN